jgi:DNA (cytosine-5)-methyltransferase 1
MRRPRLLDLYCGAGGAGEGYRRAGFDVFGVDIAAQPNNPHAFHQGDALAELDGVKHGLGDFDAIHASPPCQAYTPLGALHPDKVYPDLVAATRSMLDEIGLPYVIENVMSAPLIKERSIRLCGGMFGLRTYRHRRFESNVALVQPHHPKHVIRTATRQRRARWAEGWHVSITGDVGTYLSTEAMGIDWMNGNELSQAIPPVYTETIGHQLLAHLAEAAA